MGHLIQLSPACSCSGPRTARRIKRPAGSQAVQAVRQSRGPGRESERECWRAKDGEGSGERRGIDGKFRPSACVSVCPRAHALPLRAPAPPAVHVGRLNSGGYRGAVRARIRGRGGGRVRRPPTPPPPRRRPRRAQASAAAPLYRRGGRAASSSTAPHRHTAAPPARARAGRSGSRPGGRPRRCRPRLGLRVRLPSRRGPRPILPVGPMRWPPLRPGCWGRAVGGRGRRGVLCSLWLVGGWGGVGSLPGTLLGGSPAAASRER